MDWIDTASTLRIIVGLIVTAGTASWTGFAAARPPNIVVFLVDDMGIGDTRVYDEFCQIRLPRVEALARRGMTFTDAHAPAAVCAPTRYAILTGNYPWRGREPNGTWTVQSPSQIKPGQPTLGNLLQQAGYRTCFVGKEHLGGGLIEAKTGRIIGRPRYDHREIDFSRPIAQGLHGKGFDYVFSLPSGIQGSPYAFFENGLLVGNPAELREWKQGVYGGSVIKADGYGGADWDSSQAGPRLTEKALGFLDKHLTTTMDTPFFLYYSSQSCHAPHTPPDEFGGRRIKGGSGVSPHLDMILEADASLGLIMNRIEQAGQLDQTMFVFTSDNGGLNWSQRGADEVRHDSNGSLKGGKGQVWEGGHRVPLIVAWGDPGTSPIREGSRSSALVGLQDLYATVAELTDQPLAEGEAIDSHSFLGILMARPGFQGREELLIQSNLDNREASWGQNSSRAFRVGSWKLVVSKDHRPRNLFDLAVDPGERENLIDNPDQAGRIATMLEGYRRTISGKKSRE